MESSHVITKILVPSKRAHLLHRPRLVDFLHANIERKLLLVSASAGYGKTSLLIDFAHETTLPVCWYALDASDADPKVFLQYIVAALRCKFPEFGARTLGLLSATSVLHEVEVVVGTLVTEIFESIPGYFVLVIDDYHTVEESEPINHILDTFLRLAPENAHLVLASRTLPFKLTLTRLTARQEIAGLGVNDLRFTSEEIRALVKQSYQTDLSDAQAAELAQHSEGWITGILLTTHTLWQGLFQDLVRLQGPQSGVFNYLANEVFAQQPLELQQFLLSTSPLDELDPSVCDELLNKSNASDTLRLIEQKNLFIIRLEQEQSWYRYHHLFQEFLQARLRQSDADRWSDLNRRAAMLFENRGAHEQAIAHYFKAQLFHDAARTIERLAQETFDAGHLTTLARWMDALPPSILDAHPNLLVMRAMIYSENSEQNRALEQYADASTRFEKLGNGNGIGKTLVHQAVSLRFLGRYQEAIDCCNKALALLTADQTDEIVRAHRSIGACCILLGKLVQALKELEAALGLCESENDWTRTAWIHHELGVGYRMVGSVEAEKHFQQALGYWRQTNNAVGLATTLNSIGVGYHRQGKYAQATETLEHACEHARRAGQLRLEAYVLAGLGDVYRDERNYQGAQDAYQAAYDIAQRISEGFIIAYALTALGEIFRLIGDLITAETLLRQAVEQATSHQSNYELGLTTTALGILNCQQGNTSVAANYLTQAVELLDQSGAKRDSARAQLHLAHAHLLERKYNMANAGIQAAVDLSKDLHEDQFIISDGQHLLPLIQYAISKRIGNNYLAATLEKIKSQPTLLTPVKSVVASQPALPRLEAFGFGVAQLNLDGRMVTTTEWDAATAKELFFLLLAHSEGLRKEQILDALWGEIDPAKANGIFHSTVYRVRRALFANCIVYEDGVYRISPNIDLWYDVEQFDRLLRQAKSAPAADERAQAYRAAIALYRADYFEDSYKDWCVPLRDDLEQKFLSALYNLASYYDQGGKTEAIETYQRILQKDPYREDIYRAIMRFQSETGDRTGALKTYQQCARVLQDEMGLATSDETRTLHEQILKQTQSE